MQIILANMSHLNLFYFTSSQPIRPKEASDSYFTIEDIMLWPGMRFLRSQCKRCSAGRLHLYSFPRRLMVWFPTSIHIIAGMSLSAAQVAGATSSVSCKSQVFFLNLMLFLVISMQRLHKRTSVFQMMGWWRNLLCFHFPLQIQNQGVKSVLILKIKKKAFGFYVDVINCNKCHVINCNRRNLCHSTQQQ